MPCGENIRSQISAQQFRLCSSFSSEASLRRLLLSIKWLAKKKNIRSKLHSLIEVRAERVIIDVKNTAIKKVRVQKLIQNEKSCHLMHLMTLRNLIESQGVLIQKCKVFFKN